MTATLTAETVAEFEEQLRDSSLRRITDFRSGEWDEMAVMCEESAEDQVAEYGKADPRRLAQARVYREMAQMSRNIRRGEDPTDTVNRPRGNGSGNGTGGGRDKGMATDAQMNFLNSLLDGRDDEIAAACRARIDSVKGHVNRETASKLIETLKAPVKGMIAFDKRMSVGQRDFLVSLMTDKLNLRADIAEGMVAAMRMTTTRQEASAMIDELKAKKTVSRARAKEGFYVLNGEVYKVQRGTTTGNLFAKRLIVDASTKKGFEWVYEAGMIRNLAGAAALTQEQAKELAIETSLYGYCFMCGRKLTDEESIERMIGRICWDKL